jgi:hypothetical protein
VILPNALLAATLLAPTVARPAGNSPPVTATQGNALPPVVDLEKAYDSARIAEAGSIAVPAGYGRYCSLSYPSGGFAFDWGDANADPCATMLASTPGGTIARAGLWSKTGGNNIVVRCEDGASVLLYAIEGEPALQQAFNENKTKKKCVFTVAPKSLPVLNAPFSLNDDDVSFVNGFDFARGFTVQTNAGGTSSKVGYKGDAVGYDGHDGMDWPMPKNTTIKAVQKGVVLVARGRNIDKYFPNCPNGSTRTQNEVYVLHVVGTGVYAELFVSYYAHFDSMQVSAGDVVTKGQALGKAGSTGCSSTDHLHLEIARMSNTATMYRRHLRVPATEDYDQTTMIDPYGFSWHAKAGFDPWAWRAIADGRGALSIGLWASGQKPDRD